MKTTTPITHEKALERLETLCSRSERCTYELRQKLRTWGVAPSVWEKIIGRLIETRFVDDDRFARMFARDRIVNRGYGRRRVNLLLMQKRIDEPMRRRAIDEAVDDETYESVLAKLLTSRAQRADEIDSWESRNKLYRWAVGRGFESDLVVAVLRRVLATIAGKSK